MVGHTMLYFMLGFLMLLSDEKTKEATTGKLLKCYDFSKTCCDSIHFFPVNTTLASEQIKTSPTAL